MKGKSNLQHLFGSAACGLLLASSMNVSLAQTNLVVDTFNDDTTLSYWGHDWGSAASTFEWDPTMESDTNNTTTPGALKITVAYDLASYGGGNDCAIQRVLGDLGGQIDLTLYTNLHYDVFVDTNSAQMGGWGNGQLGQMNWYIRDPSWNFVSMGGPWIPADNYGKWEHKVVGLDPLSEWNNNTNYVGTNVARMGYQMWSGWAAPVGLTNAVTYWVDNVWLEYNTNTAPPPPPKLTLAPNSSHKGVTIVDSASGQYPRQSIATDMTTGNDYGWIGKGSTPVTNALTIADFPKPQDSAFQAHVFLTPSYGTENSPDWNQPNVIFLQISQSTSAVATATFRYKTNLAGGNSMMYNADPANGPVGILATLDSTNGPLGTWSLEFLNDTNITLKAPGGGSTNFSLTADAAALFGTALVRAYFGNQPNDTSYRGVYTTFSRIQITGVAAPVDDSFPGPDLNQDPSVVSWQWVKQMDDPSGLFISAGNYPYLMTWTMPDFGYTLQTTPSLQPSSWSDLSVSNVFSLGSSKQAFLPASALPSTSTAYFRMKKQ